MKKVNISREAAHIAFEKKFFPGFWKNYLQVFGLRLIDIVGLSLPFRMETSIAVGTNDNPYVSVVVKKYRNLKKRVDKLTKIDADCKSGKVIAIYDIIFLYLA